MIVITRHIRLFLIISLALMPVQSLFAMSMDEQTGTTMVMAADMASHGEQMMQESHGEHCDNGHCQDLSQCSNCPLLLGLPQIIPMRYILMSQLHSMALNSTIHSLDLLPDYRPPRYS